MEAMKAVLLPGSRAHAREAGCNITLDASRDEHTESGRNRERTASIENETEEELEDDLEDSVEDQEEEDKTEDEDEEEGDSESSLSKSLDAEWSAEGSGKSSFGSIVWTTWSAEVPCINVADTYADGLRLASSDRDAKGGEMTHKFSCPNTLPHPDFWPTKPLLFRESMVHYGWDSKTNIGNPLSTQGVAFPFETNLFVGTAMFRMQGLPEASEYFDGRSRLSSVVISGKFKEELAFADVQTGQEFCKPVKRPSQFVLKPVVKFFRLLAPLLQIYVGDQTYMLSPLAQTVQIMHVSDEPLDLTPNMEVKENFGAVELGESMSRAERKKFFSKQSNLEKFSFRTDRVYTFDFFNNKLDMENFQLRAIGQSFEVQPYLRGQPLRVLSRVFKDGDPENKYLWNFELWHEKVLDFLNTDSCSTANHADST